jgi:hypothetical protein
LAHAVRPVAGLPGGVDRDNGCVRLASDAVVAGSRPRANRRLVVVEASLRP